MSKFKIESRPQRRGTKKKNFYVMYKYPSNEVRDAIAEAAQDNNITKQELINQFIIHCLKESGYLK